MTYFIANEFIMILSRLSTDTRQSYIDNGFPLPDPDNLNFREKKFLSADDKFPVIRKLTRFIRLKWRNPDVSPPEEKDYLVYYENWFLQ